VGWCIPSYIRDTLVAITDEFEWEMPTCTFDVSTNGIHSWLELKSISKESQTVLIAYITPATRVESIDNSIHLFIYAQGRPTNYNIAFQNVDDAFRVSALINELTQQAIDTTAGRLDYLGIQDMVTPYLGPISKPSSKTLGCAHVCTFEEAFITRDPLAPTIPDGEVFDLGPIKASFMLKHEQGSREQAGHNLTPNLNKTSTLPMLPKAFIRIESETSWGSVFAQIPIDLLKFDNDFSSSYQPFVVSCYVPDGFTFTVKLNPNTAGIGFGFFEAIRQYQELCEGSEGGDGDIKSVKKKKKEDDSYMSAVLAAKSTTPRFKGKFTLSRRMMDTLVSVQSWRLQEGSLLFGF
jgi:hypothetical protein